MTTAPVGHCTHDRIQQRGPLSLPVLRDHEPQGVIRKSRSGRRRAWVLLTVQLLMIAHVVQWWWTGRTTTPVEPSESMEFVKNGVMNAGLIFFAAALLSTMLLGRWFCGWGCHVVLLQDGCGWLMKKLGVRPRPFRSRLLLFVPLLLALYMFVWPAAYRWGLVPLDGWMDATLGWDHWSVTSLRGVARFFDIPLGAPQAAWTVRGEFTTDNFWQTFPGVVVAVPFLLVCGFATVYFLGAKGFCTYGCPYGGFFAPLDKLAPGRILVNDNCEQCGHCTAVCTSNVRVHDEVREYGMVVDPGCMKCLDCVSVCPNDALFFGLGRPAVLKRAAKTRAPAPRWDLTWGEEVGLAAVFAGTFFATRGLYGMVPLLMAAGLAGIVTFLAWKLWRLIGDEHARLHQFQLKLHGQLTRGGLVFAALAVLALALTLHSGAVQALQFAGQKYDNAVTIPPQLVFGEQAFALPEPMAKQARAGAKLYRLASNVGQGGIALAPPGPSGIGTTRQGHLDLRRAWLHSTLREFDAAQRILRRALDRDGAREPICAAIASVMRGRQSVQDTMAYYEQTLEKHPQFEGMLDEYITWLTESGLVTKAVEVSRQALQRHPASLRTKRRLSVMEVMYGDIDSGIRLINETLEVEPRNPNAWFYLAVAWQRQGEAERALEALRQGLELSPDDIRINEAMANLLTELGRPQEAQPYRDRAQQRQQELDARLARHAH